MSSLLIAGLVMVALAALDYAALRWGVDSRPGFADGRKPTGKLALR
jgi:hypothetical protein